MGEGERIDGWGKGNGWVRESELMGGEKEMDG